MKLIFAGMARVVSAVSAVAIMLSLTLLPTRDAAAAPPHKEALSKAQRMHHYQSEHNSRLTRHAHLTPAQKHARALRYAKEHQARMHRHRAHVRAQRRHEP